MKEKEIFTSIFKKIILCLCAICFCSNAVSETINWYVDGDVYATTNCESGDDVILPTTPEKPGHVFLGWTEYQPIEYIESTGTQYINTEIIQQPYTTSYGTKLKYLYPNSVTEASLCGLLCSQNNSWGQPFSANKTAELWGGNPNQKLLTSGYLSPDTIYEDEFTADIDSGTITRILNENSFQNTNINFNNPSPQPIFVFAANDCSGKAKQLAKIRLYYFKIYLDNVLVRDMIPVLDPNNTPCMYDLVSQQFFYNAGTGEFIAGPSIYK